MAKDINVYLEDILDSIGRIQEYTRGIDLESFEDNLEHQDAVMRRLEIIGEAVKHLPEDLKTKYSQVPWKQIAGMRDILIHEYAGVLVERVWKVIADDLAPLKETVEKMRVELPKE